jgi:hypothetical protein
MGARGARRRASPVLDRSLCTQLLRVDGALEAHPVFQPKNVLVPDVPR